MAVNPCESLLLGEHVVGERPEGELRPINGSLLRSEINAARLGEDGRDLIAAPVGPCRRLRDSAIDGRDDVRMLGGESAADQKERVLRAHFSVERQGARLLLELGDGEEWVPDRPRVDRAARESRSSVRRREIDRRYRGPRNVDAIERGDEQVMGARPPGDRDLLAFKTGDVLDRRARRHDDRLAIPTGRNRRGVEQIRMRRLGEDRRRVAGIAAVDGASRPQFARRPPPPT
jgi:hypothetical protein